MRINSEDFNIKVLRCTYFDGSNLKIENSSFREVYDYEIEFFTYSDGGIITNEKYTPFEKGTVNFRTPGQVVSGIFPYSCYSICFDVAGKKTRENYTNFGTKEQAQPDYISEILNGIKNKITFVKYNNIENMIAKIYRNFHINTEIANLEIKAEMYNLLKELFYASSKKEFNIYIKKGIEFIQKNLENDIKISDIADHLSISANYFQKIFKETLNTTPNNYIINLRLEKAKFLLVSSNMKISDIGFESGFLDNVYFSYVFLKKAGMTPSEYRNKNRI